MTYLDYYFTKCFQWKHNWFSAFGLLRPVIRLSDTKRDIYGWVDFSILESVFITPKMQELIYVQKKIEEINGVILGTYKKTSVYNEIVELEINHDFSRPIDNLGDSEGIEAPLSWNISTPIEVQNIPTTEILKLFEDWKKFLTEQKDVILNIDNKAV